MAIVENAASYIQLYSDGNAKETNKFQIEVKDSGVVVKDSKSDRDLKFQCKAVKIADATGLNQYDVGDRFDDAEADISSNTAAASAAQTSADQEKVRAQAAEAGLQSNLDAEVARAGAAESSISASVSAMDAAYKAADSALDQKIQDEENARVQAINQEAQDRANAVAAVQLQITNLLSGSPETLDTLSEITAFVNNLDDAQADLISALTAEVNQLRAEVDQLLNM